MAQEGLSTVGSVLLPELLLYFLSSESCVCETEVRHVYPRGEVRGIDVVLIMTHLRNIKDKKVSWLILTFHSFP